jgi:hypothetical protein
MKRFRNLFPALLVMGLMAAGVSGQMQRSYRGTFQSMQQLLNRIEDRTDLFRDSLDFSLERTPIDTARAEDNIDSFTSDFEDAVRRLHERFDQRASNASDAQDVLSKASFIDRFMRRHTLDARSQRYWTSLRADLDQLASAYGVSWPSSYRGYRTPAREGYRLTGTYRLDPSRSDNPQDAADRALQSLSYSEQQRLRDLVMRRLEAPDQIAIDVRGSTVTLASTRAPQFTFQADGREHIETTNSGRTIRSRATLTGNQLMVSVTGDSENEFNVTFNPIENGQRLSVERRLYIAEVGRSVISQSAYNKTSDVAMLDLSPGPSNYPTRESSGDFLLRSGETVVAELLDPLSTATAHDGDRFRMRVRLPEQYAGATIEGHVSDVQRSGRITGRSQMTFNFDSIRLRNGASYRFAGIVERVNTPDGKTARVDNEGVVRDQSQSTKTAQRAVIGTAIGALIGAIAGGGKGAAIGAVLGAGAGAGSVYVQGTDDLDLPIGSEVTIQATGPQSRD